MLHYARLMTSRKIVVELPDSMTDAEHAELANAVWASAIGASAILIEAQDVDAVSREMDRQWKEAPEWTGRGWRKPRSGSRST